jgi:hypothetical protein
MSRSEQKARRYYARYSGQLAELLSILNAAGYRYNESFNCCSEPDMILTPPADTDMWGGDWWPNKLVVTCTSCGERCERSAVMDVVDDYGNYLRIDQSVFVKWIENKAHSLQVFEFNDVVSPELEQRLGDIRFEINQMNHNGTDYSKNKFVDFEYDLGNILQVITLLEQKVMEAESDPLAILRQRLLSGTEVVDNGNK